MRQEEQNQKNVITIQYMILTAVLLRAPLKRNPSSGAAVRVGRERCARALAVSARVAGACVALASRHPPRHRHLAMTQAERISLQGATH